MSALIPAKLPKLTQNPNPVYVSETDAAGVAERLEQLQDELAKLDAKYASKEAEFRSKQAQLLAKSEEIVLTTERWVWKLRKVLMSLLVLFGSISLLTTVTASGWKWLAAIVGSVIGVYAVFHSYLLADRKTQ